MTRNRDCSCLVPGNHSTMGSSQTAQLYQKLEMIFLENCSVVKCDRVHTLPVLLKKMQGIGRLGAAQSKRAVGNSSGGMLPLLLCAGPEDSQHLSELYILPCDTWLPSQQPLCSVHQDTMDRAIPSRGLQWRVSEQEAPGGAPRRMYTENAKGLINCWSHDEQKMPQEN